MSKIPKNLLYTEDDEWIKIEGDQATVGITDHAQDSLSDIVYLELPTPGESFAMGETFGVVESVKAAADLYMPVSGEVLESNDGLADSPELVNEDPYGQGWMIRISISNPGELQKLLNPEAYQQNLDERN